MFANTVVQFKTMRSSVRALVFLLWIYALTTGMVNVFTQIFLYQKFTSLSLNILAQIAFYTGIMFGFCIPGFFAGVWRLNVKYGFVLGFVVMSAAILYLLTITTVGEAYLAMFMRGIGDGVLWLAVNTFELTETEDVERDLYSSFLNAGNQVWSLVGPALATLLIWISGTVLHWGSYTLLFTTTPAIFLLGFLCFPYLRDYRPAPIRFSDVKHYFSDRANQAAQLYTLGTGFQQIALTTIPPLVILFILGTTLRVGIYNTLFAIFSALCILFVAQYRTTENRLLIYGLTTGGILLAIVWLGHTLTLTALIAYTLIDGILSPLMNVSSHVVDLAAMEIGRKDADFYATVILRDFFLWVWRALGGVVLLMLVGLVTSEHELLSWGLYMLAGSLLVTYLGAALFLRIRRVRN